MQFGGKIILHYSEIKITLDRTVESFRWKNSGERIEDWKKKIGYRVISLDGHLYKSLVESIEDKGRLDEINASYRCASACAHLLLERNELTNRRRNRRAVYLPLERAARLYRKAWIGYVWNDYTRPEKRDGPLKGSDKIIASLTGIMVPYRLVSWIITLRARELLHRIWGMTWRQETREMFTPLKHA